MLLWLLEHADMAEIDLNEALEPLTLADPVEAMHTVSHDLTLAAPLHWKQVEPPPHGRCRSLCVDWYMRPRQRYTAPTHPESRHGRPAPPATSWRCGGRLSPTSPPYAMPDDDLDRLTMRGTGVTSRMAAQMAVAGETTPQDRFGLDQSAPGRGRSEMGRARSGRFDFHPACRTDRTTGDG